MFLFLIMCYISLCLQWVMFLVIMVFKIEVFVLIMCFYLAKRNISFSLWLCPPPLSERYLCFYEFYHSKDDFSFSLWLCTLPLYDRYLCFYEFYLSKSDFSFSLRLYTLPLYDRYFCFYELYLSTSLLFFLSLIMCFTWKVKLFWRK